MSDEYQTEPIMDKALNSTEAQKRVETVPAVDHDPSADPSPERSDQLHEDLDETDVEPGERA